MLVGNLGALAQTNLKRLLAYSGIAQVGYIVAAFAGGTAYGLRYGVFYLAAYLFMNLGVFAVIALLSREDDEGARLAAYAGLGKQQPILAGVLSFFLIGLAGLPPTAGFLGKILILASSVNAGYAWLAVTLIIGTAISIYAYFKIIRVMYVPTRHGGGGEAVLVQTVSPIPWVAVVGCAIAVFAFGVYPFVPSAILPLIK
jgi:NADH-quinone oxidoreductase subunit N